MNVPMLDCKDPRCDGTDVPQAVILGQDHLDDQFGSINAPHLFNDLNWYTERQVTLLKYHDMSEELNRFERTSVQIGPFISPKSTAAIDNCFEFITVDSESFDEFLKEINLECDEEKFERKTISYEIENNERPIRLDVLEKSSCQDFLDDLMDNMLFVNFSDYRFALPTQNLFLERNGKCSLAIATINNMQIDQNGDLYDIHQKI